MTIQKLIEVGGGLQPEVDFDKAPDIKMLQRPVRVFAGRMNPSYVVAVNEKNSHCYILQEVWSHDLKKDPARKKK